MTRARSLKATEENDAVHVGPAVSTTDLEPTPSHESLAAGKGDGVHSRVRIHIHSRRRRLADPDGISAKAAIDGLTAGGILADDSAKFVEEVSFSQEVGEDEETVITIDSP